MSNIKDSLKDISMTLLDLYESELVDKGHRSNRMLELHQKQYEVLLKELEKRGENKQ